jgi:hypothetical protein
MTEKEIMYANPLEWKLMVAKNTGNTKVTYDELNGLVETIKSQQAEIERLTTLSELGKMRANDYRVMRDRALKAEKEIERLQIRLRKVRNQFTDLSKMHSEIKAEAIKEFANELYEEIEKALENNYKVKQERLGKLIALGITEQDTLLQYIEGKIDCLRGLKWFIKEMVGEDK